MYVAALVHYPQAILFICKNTSHKINIFFFSTVISFVTTSWVDHLIVLLQQQLQIIIILIIFVKIPEHVSFSYWYPVYIFPNWVLFIMGTLKLYCEHRWIQCTHHFYWVKCPQKTKGNRRGNSVGILSTFSHSYLGI